MGPYRLQRATKHQKNSFLSNVLQKSFKNVLVPSELKEVLESMPYPWYAETLGLSRKLKLSFRKKQSQIGSYCVGNLVMIDHGNMGTPRKVLPNRTARVSINSLCSPWISTFDAPAYVCFSDCGYNLAVELLKQKLYGIEYQLYPITTKPSWYISHSDRSHPYLHKSLDRLLLKQVYDTGHNREVP